MKIIGITGGVGAGKSLILSYIKQHYKCKIYLADEVAGLLRNPGSPCYEELRAVLGEECYDEQGFVKKDLMAARIFGNETLLDKVNGILHPGVRTFLEKQVLIDREDGETELFFVEAALLIEKGYHDFVDEMWYIYAPVEVRLKRLAENRGYSVQKAESIMATQLSEEMFRSNTDFTIDNGSDPEIAYGQIRSRLEGYTWLD